MVARFRAKEERRSKTSPRSPGQWGRKRSPGHSGWGDGFLARSVSWGGVGVETLRGGRPPRAGCEDRAGRGRRRSAPAGQTPGGRSSSRCSAPPANGALAVAQRQAGRAVRTTQRIATAPQTRESLAWADQRAKSESPQRSRVRKNCENWVSQSGVCPETVPPALARGETLQLGRVLQPAGIWPLRERSEAVNHRGRWWLRLDTMDFPGAGGFMLFSAS